MQHGGGERERHAEDGHGEVGDGQVDEERPQVGARAATDRQDDDHDHVAGDGEQRRRRVERDQHVLVLVRQAGVVPLRRPGVVPPRVAGRRRVQSRRVGRRRGVVRRRPGHAPDGRVRHDLSRLSVPECCA